MEYTCTCTQLQNNILYTVQQFCDLLSLPFNIGSISNEGGSQLMVAIESGNLESSHAIL